MKWSQRIVLFVVGLGTGLAAALAAALTAGVSALAIRFGITLWQHHGHHPAPGGHSHHSSHDHGHDHGLTWSEFLIAAPIVLIILLILSLLPWGDMLGWYWAARAVTVPLTVGLFVVALATPSTQPYATKLAAFLGISVGALIALVLILAALSPLFPILCF